MNKFYIITSMFLLITTKICFAEFTSAPTNFTGVETSPGTITFSWTDNSNNETGFYIEKLISASNNWEMVCKVSSNLTSISCIAISNNIYRISAYRGIIIYGRGWPSQSSYCQTCIGLLADLTVSNISPSKTILNAGESFSVSYTVNNIGTYKTLFETWVRIFISSTSNEPGVLAGTTEYFQKVDAGLVIGSSISKNLTVTTPTGNGTYYIMCIVSPSAYKHTPELSTSNNCATTAIEIASSDLTTSSLTLSKTTVDAGSSVNVSCSVNNIGNINAPSSTLKYYISNTSTGKDQELGSFTIGEISAGASTSHTTTLTIPSTYVGSYYIVSMANATGSISEPASNNFASKQISVTNPNAKPYFQVTDISLSETQSSNLYLYTVSIKNNGTQSGTIPKGLINIKARLDTDLDELWFFANYGFVDCLDFMNIEATESIAIGETKSFSTTHGFPGSSAYWMIPNIKNWDDKTSYIARKFSVSTKEIKVPPIEQSKRNTNPNNIDISLYPNPSNGQFSVNLDKDSYTEVRVYSLLGQLVYSEKVKNKSKIDFNLTHLSNGTYIIHLLGGDKPITKKITIL